MLIDRKKILMKKLLFAASLSLLLGLSLTSCTTDVDDEQTLLGRWVEVSPVEDRTELFFRTGNRVARTTADGSTEIYNYEISNNNIVLSLTGELEGSSELFFEQVDENTFRIGDLYPHIPEAEPVILVFERK